MRSHLDRGRESLGLLLLSIQLSCAGAYDRNLIDTPERCGDGQVDKGELCDTGIPSGKRGACPTECAPGAPCAPRMLLGTGCSQQCEAVPITKALNGDGCCPKDATAAQDSDCGKCGDGIIGPGEVCDPPSMCPTAATCAMTQSCLAGVLTGSPDKCTARCERTVIDECRSEDNCCPERCTSEEDSDCSAFCGNGTIEEMAGETCEPRLRSNPCPTDCDDGNPCTEDLMTGSSRNCNASCTNMPITQPANGDHCCPKGANASIDDDCAPVCGNGVPEPGEECDGGDLCTAACRVLTPEQRQCMDLPTSASPLCESCSCLKCPVAMLGCYQSGNEERDRLCSAVVECSNAAGCLQDACYCGNAACTVAGPCQSEVMLAAKAMYRMQVYTCSMTESCAVYWSRLIGECRSTLCAAECATPPAPATTVP